MQIPLSKTAAVALCAVACVVNAEHPEPSFRFEFAALDTNGDMYVDPQEFGDFTERMREAMRARFGDGRGAAADRVLKLYGGADADGDGLLNEAEFDALREKMEGMRQQMRRRPRDR